MNEPLPIGDTANVMPGWQFVPICGLPGRIRLQCNWPLILKGRVTAYVNGIVVGQIEIHQSLDDGEYIEIPILYFPYVDLPAKIRFMVDEVEISSPFFIKSAEDVMAILSTGDITVDNLRLDNSLLRGVIVNSTNGVFVPSAFVRLNGHVVRSVILEPPRPRNEGGTTAKLAVPIRANDFMDGGLLVELHLAGVDHPIASFSYIRGTLTGEVERLLKLTEKVRQLEKSTVLQVELLKGTVDHRLNIHQERLDAFIEYAMALMLDNLAGQIGRADPSVLSEAWQQLRAVGNRTNSTTISVFKPPSISVSLDSPGFSVGWYDIESNENGHFRWMGRTGLIRNPDVSRPIASIKIIVSQVYGAAEPMIRGFLDEEELTATQEKDGACFLVTLTPPPNGVARGESLTLESFATGCPATDHGTSDNRLLSISAAEVRFQYDGHL